jgi:hypothetical protein
MLTVIDWIQVLLLGAIGVFILLVAYAVLHDIKDFLTAWRNRK